MAFHVACPFTCRKICCCTFGTPAPLRTQSGQNEFLQRTSALQSLLANPRLMLGGGPEYVEIPVPPLPNQPKKSLEDQGFELLDDSGDDGLTKRAGTRRKATFSIVGQAEASAKSSHSKRLESAKYASRQHASREASANGWADRERAGMSVRGGLEDELDGSENFESLIPQVVCGLCGCGEAIGSDKAGRMLSCQACRKQYHRKCTKHWAEHRDLFNWTSWTCGSCRICEVCTRTGDSNKLMFCKRCDQAHHSTCLQPPLKHVLKGPFVCPKHVRCTSCNTTVPGGGMSSKWFLSYSLCDACGRLFTRGKYCPICLKVYRDSEPAPMVCCDVCEHWVHCECDGISDEKYEEFQVNSQLRYTCASCRGECYKVADLDEAAIEIWRRKDIKDSAQIAEFRAAAGIPSQEEIANACPSSDEEDREPEGNGAEDASHKSSKKKVKKVPVGVEGLIKSTRKPKIVTTKDASKSTMTPSKLEGAGGKPNPILPPVNSEKTSTKKSKKGSTASGNGQEKSIQIIDSISNSVAEGDNPKKVKKTVLSRKIVPSSGADIAVEAPKDKKRKSDGSKEKSPLTRKHRGSKAGELDDVRNDTPQEGVGKIKKLKITNPEETAVRQEQTEVPSTSFERHVIQGGKERASVKVAKNESDINLTSAGTFSASHGEAATMPDSQIEVGDAENSVRAQQTQAGRGSSPLHWAGHSDSVRRRRVPSSKYRDMDTSAWRHSRTNKDLLSTQNPEPGSTAQTFNERIEAITPAQKAPILPGSADSRKERRRKPANIEDNVDNDDSLDNSRKKLKMTDLSEKKADEQQLLHDSPASDSPATTRLLRVKIRKQPTRETVTPGASKDGKKTLEEVGEAAPAKDHHPSKKKRSAAAQKSVVEDSAQRRLAVKDAVGDDSWILQRLGTDAISKRVEIFWPIDDIWYKGTVVAVFPDKLKFSVDYDDGEQETLEFGKEKVRLLSTTKKS